MSGYILGLLFNRRLSERFRGTDDRLPEFMVQTMARQPARETRKPGIWEKLWYLLHRSGGSPLAADSEHDGKAAGTRPKIPQENHSQFLPLPNDYSHSWQQWQFRSKYLDFHAKWKLHQKRIFHPAVPVSDRQRPEPQSENLDKGISRTGFLRSGICCFYSAIYTYDYKQVHLLTKKSAGFFLSPNRSLFSFFLRTTTMLLKIQLKCQKQSFLGIYKLKNKTAGLLPTFLYYELKLLIQTQP